MVPPIGTVLERPANAVSDSDAMAFLRWRIAGGDHWFVALLGAIRLWRTPWEDVDGRRFVYLYGGEAFDYLVLAERLLESIPDLLPRDEWAALVLEGEPPLELTAHEFQELVGPEKYRTHLNFVYGIAVEEALQQAAEDAADKAMWIQPCAPRERITRRVFDDLYEAPVADLLARWRGERGLPPSEAISLAQQRDFTYWLFKHRLKTAHKARIASDTRRALDYLGRLESRNLGRRPGRAHFLLADWAREPVIPDAPNDSEAAPYA